MDEDEAAMLALGSVLKWEQTENSSIDEWMAEVEKPIASVYIVNGMWMPGTVPAQPRYEAQLLFDPEEVETQHPTLAAAKAACERHHATGQWE